MSSSNAPTIEDEGTRPSSQTVDTIPFRNTAETPILLSHEDESPPPSQAVTTGTNATPETTSTTISSPSVTSGVVSDMDELSATDSSTSLTGTEIMTMRRQRIIDRIMQHFCQHLDQISKGNAHRTPTKLVHQTMKRGSNLEPRECLLPSPVTLQDPSRSLPGNKAGKFSALSRPSLPKSTGCDDVPAVFPGLPGPDSLENAESLFLKQATTHQPQPTLILGSSERFNDIMNGSNFSYDYTQEYIPPPLMNNAPEVQSRDSGICMTESVPGEPSKEGYSGECWPEILISTNSKPDPWTAVRDSEDLRFSKHLPSALLTSHVSEPWYPQELELDDEPEPPTKVNGIFHDPTFTPNMHLSVNTMRSEIGRSVNDTNLSDGVRKHAAEDDGDHDGRRKRQKAEANGMNRKPQAHNGRKFACPFFKRNARKYSKWTSCPGPGWDEIHRVKSHLYRRHELIQCPRCWSTHKNNKSLIAHLQTDPPCEKQQNLSIVDGVTPEQKEKLLSRKKTHGDMTDEEKWRHMYMILFPDDDEDSIPSPYYEESDGSELEDYARFFRREMPPFVRRELESLPDQEFQNRERLLQRLVEIISNMQSRLLDVYQQSITSAPVHEQRTQSTEPRASGSGSGTTPSASDSLNTLTPPPAPDLVVNADEFADSLLGLDFEYTEMDSEELQRLLDEFANDGKST